MNLFSKETRFQIKHFSLFFLFLLLFVFTGTVFNSHSFGADLFVSSTGSGESCYQNAPCDLQTAITNANNGDTVFVAGIAGETYYGTGENVIEITNSINLIGGWDGSPTGDIVVDPEANPTILDGEETRRVIHISGSGETPTIDGFTITNGNATGLVADCGNSPEGCGGGIFIYQADPIISSNVISNNYAAKAHIPSGYIGYGGGIFIRDSDLAEIINNQIFNNVGSTFGDGEGGGMDVHDCGSGIRINNNRFFNNFATTASSVGWGGGIALTFSDGLLENNIFENNTASPTTSLGSGIFGHYGAPTINSNMVIGNQNTYAVYLGYFDGSFQANRVLENSTQYAVYIINGDSSSATISNNIIEGTDTYTLYLDAYSSYPLTATVKHNTLVGKGSSYGVYIRDDCTVTMTNNIVSNHTNGVTLSFASGATSYLTQNNTLFYGNTSNGELGTNSVIGDPAFKNESESDYRIKGTSAAKDAGIDAGIPEDIEGTERPKGAGYDIGAYEFYPAGIAGVLLMLFD